MIARLKKERDEARSLLAQAERQFPVSTQYATGNAVATSNGKRGIHVFWSIFLVLHLFFQCQEIRMGQQLMTGLKHITVLL